MHTRLSGEVDLGRSRRAWESVGDPLSVRTITHHDCSQPHNGRSKTMDLSLYILATRTSKRSVYFFPFVFQPSLVSHSLFIGAGTHRLQLHYLVYTRFITRPSFHSGVYLCNNEHPRSCVCALTFSFYQLISVIVFFYGLNAVRIFSLVSLILVFCSSILVIVTDVRAVNRFLSGNSDQDMIDCDYIECVVWFFCVCGMLMGLN